MELNWTTFILEIINFLVLVWILKRFFYAPVREVIARRRAAIDRDLAEAEAIRVEAEGAEQQYRQRLGDWEREREAARQTLHQEIEGERTRLREELAVELQKEKDKAGVLAERQQLALRREVETAALVQAGRFLRQLLNRLAGPELEARILILVGEELAVLAPERREALRRTVSGEPAPVLVAESAFPLNKEQRRELREVWRKNLEVNEVTWEFRENPELLAGLRLSLGAWTLAANLRDELDFFLEGGHAEG
jgi:F-type H+-transporting ATPase subunit b